MKWKALLTAFCVIATASAVEARGYGITIPAIGHDGWTQFVVHTGTGTCGNSSSNYTGDCFTYVSNSTGNDACVATTPPQTDTPNAANICATIQRAITLLRSRSGDRILLLKGDTWDEGISNSSGYLNTKDLGKGCSQPTIFGAYPSTPGARPLITQEGGPIFTMGSTTDSGWPDSVAFVGLEFSNPTKDPNDVRYNQALGGVNALGSVWAIGCMWIEDVKTTHTTMGLFPADINRAKVAQDRVVINRSVLSLGPGAGNIFWTNFRPTVIQTVFDSGGWDPIVSAPTTVTFTNGSTNVTWPSSGVPPTGPPAAGGLVANFREIFTNAGSGGTPGFYPNVALTTISGVGSGVHADITVQANGTVKFPIQLVQTIGSQGTGYVANDQVGANAGDIGGTTGFATKVGGVSSGLGVMFKNDPALPTPFQSGGTGGCAGGNTFCVFCVLSTSGNTAVLGPSAGTGGIAGACPGSGTPLTSDKNTTATAYNGSGNGNGASQSAFDHNFYFGCGSNGFFGGQLQGAMNVRQNIFYNDASGLKPCGGGDIIDNLFINNPYAFGIGSFPCDLNGRCQGTSYNIIQEGVDQIQPPSSFGIGIFIDNTYCVATANPVTSCDPKSTYPGLSGAIARYNLISDASTAQVSNGFGISLGTNSNYVGQMYYPAVDNFTFTDNVICKWKIPILDTASGALKTFGAITAGSGYADGTYNNVPMTGGHGSGLLATVVVAGGAVTSVSWNVHTSNVGSQGKGYQVGDSLSASNTNLGGTGSGFAVAVASVSVNVLSPNTLDASTCTGHGFLDPTRTALTYDSTVLSVAACGSGSCDGNTVGTLANFMCKEKKQSRDNWCPALEIPTVNSWIRAGYNLPDPPP